MTVHLLLTRPAPQSRRFLEQLSRGVRAQVAVLISPLLEIAALVARLDTGPARGLIFSSGNGVAVAAAALTGRDLPAFCVGPATTQAARAAGWPAICAGSDAAGLIDHLKALRPDTPLLHLRGRHARGDVDLKLTAVGLPCTARAIYDQTLQPLTAAACEALESGAPVLVPLFSPRTARHFAEICPPGACVYLAALSPAVADEIKQLDYKDLIVCDRPDAAAMAASVAILAQRSNRVETGRGAQ